MDEFQNFTLAEMDKEHLFHPVTSIADQQRRGPEILADAAGVELRDIHGNSYVDGGAGLWCVNAGYGDTTIAEAGYQALKTLSYTHLFGATANEPAIRLANRIAELFRDHADAGHLSKVFFGTSGSDANDTAFKMVRYYNNLLGRSKKKKFIARQGAYHGLTHAATALTGISAYHNAFDVLDGQVIHVSCPHYYRFGKVGETEDAFCDRLIDEIKDVIVREGADAIAAFIAEPIMGTGGVLIPPKGYFEKLQPLLKENDILFVVDEVITGFGRLGDWFAIGAFGLKPDIVTLAKGMTSAYFPMSATVFSEAVWNVLRDASEAMGPVMHGFTYSGHPVGAAIGLANIDVLDRKGLIGNAAKMGPMLLERLRAAIADHPCVGDVRGRGLMIAVEFVADKRDKRAFAVDAAPHKKVAAAVAAQGLMVRALPFLNVTSISPPLCLTATDVDEIVKRYVAGLDAVTGELQQLV